MHFLTENIEMIITFITMIVTWILGFLAKKSPYINNNLIVIQNIIIGIITAILYYIITKDFSIAIAMSGIIADTGYNLVHNIQKLIDDKKSDQNNKSVNQ